MMETIRKSLRDRKAARWTALMIVSFTMLCSYYVADVMSPLKPMIEQRLGWTSSEYGFFTGAYAWFNVFLGVLVLGGVVLDKMGARFTGIASSALMVAGCGLKWWAVQTHVLDRSTVHFFFWDFKSQVLLAAVGFAIFGAGIEIFNVVTSKVTARWFLGYEIALAMGLSVSTARLGTALALGMGAPIASYFNAVAAPVLVGVVLLGVGLLAYIVYCVLDKRLDASEREAATSEEEAFHLSDIGKILRIRGFWYITILCALFYSSVFPFLKYAPDLMVQKFQVRESLAGAIPSVLPFATIPLTVVFGRYYDRHGKGATLMITGSLLLVLVHFVFAVPFLNSWLVALAATIVLGFAFSLVPSAMWPSLPKFIPQHQLGTAYAVIFWMQNLVALWGVPYLIGWILDRYCITGTRVVGGLSSPTYNYTLPMSVFTTLGALAVLFGVLLKREDKKRNYGLELPCQKAS